jgi:hypothetical protein
MQNKSISRIKKSTMKKLILIVYALLTSSLYGMEKEQSDLHHQISKLKHEKAVIQVLKKELVLRQTRLIDIQEQQKHLLRQEPYLQKEEKLLQELINLLHKKALAHAQKYQHLKQSLLKHCSAVLQTHYPILYHALPLRYYNTLVLFISQLSDKVLTFANQSPGTASTFIWENLNQLFNLGIKKVWDGKRGYIFFTLDETQGALTPYDCHEIPQLHARKAFDHEAQKHLKNIAGQYKIHLMPHRFYMPELIIKLIKAIKQDHQFAQTLATFKVKYSQTTAGTVQVRAQSQKERLPRIVIYTAEGKDNAQRALNKILSLFKHDVEKGIDATPRWNQRVNKLVSFAQGDGDCKKLLEFKEYFEQPAMVYYHPLFTGTYENHHLDC